MTIAVAGRTRLAGRRADGTGEEARDWVHDVKGYASSCADTDTSQLCRNCPRTDRPRRMVDKGDPRQPFGEIAGAVALADGTVIVSDERNAALFAVSAEARSVTMLARSGSGPGEVRLPTLLARASNETPLRTVRSPMWPCTLPAVLSMRCGMADSSTRTPHRMRSGTTARWATTPPRFSRATRRSSRASRSRSTAYGWWTAVASGHPSGGTHSRGVSTCSATAPCST